MKVRGLIISLIIFIYPFLKSHSQDQKLMSLTKASGIVDSIFVNYSTTESPELCSGKTMNLIYGKLLEDYFSLTGRSSPQQLSAFLNSNDNSFAFGYTWSLDRNNPIKYLNHLLNVGVRIKRQSQDSFITFFESGEFSDDIGLDVRFTQLLKETSARGRAKERASLKSLRENIDSFRTNYLKPSVLEGLAWDILNEGESEYGPEVEYLISKKEAEYILENRYLENAYISWFTFEAFIPLTNTTYQISQQKTPLSIIEKEFRNWSAGVLMNNLFKYKDMSFTLSGQVKLFNSNNILIGDIGQVSYQKADSMVQGEFFPIEEKSVIVGVFQEFITPQLRAEFTSLLFGNESVGLSAAIEKNFSTQYDALNWKLGIPLSLKNAEGVNAINFEIQWREINGAHSIGVSMGKSFGKFAR